MLDIIMDTLLDSVKLLPFLFLTYLCMELLEHKAGGKLLKKRRIIIEQKFYICKHCQS